MNKVKVYVTLLKEGTPTIRETQALDRGRGSFELLPTENYNPEDEVWEFVPGTIVSAQEISTETGDKVLLASRPFSSKQEIIVNHKGTPIVATHVFLRWKSGEMVKTEALALENGMFKILPTDNYNPVTERWEFTPGSVVRAAKEKVNGKEILIAFDQIREDRMNEHYARYVTRREE